MSSKPALSVALLLPLAAAVLAQQRGGPPPPRKHTATRAQPLRLEPATERAPVAPKSEFLERGDELRISANGIPEHPVGAFPNPGNPNSIRPQGYEIVLPADPQPAAKVTTLRLGPFGIALNGVFFDPGAAEFWQGNLDSGWQYEALGGAVPLGLDENHAHVQPSGAYHYHGIPALLLKQYGAGPGRHSPQIGWAADGFPIYAKWGFAEPMNSQSKVVELKSGWRLKTGPRPGGADGPGGTPDGAFMQDYEFTGGAGSLDECNGRHCVTPEFPEGTYAYFLTEAWPVIPRAHRGTPVRLRMGGPPGGGGGPGPGGPGGPEGRPPRPPQGKNPPPP